MPVSKKRKKKGNGAAKNLRAHNNRLARQRQGNLQKLTSMIDYLEKVEREISEEEADVHES